MAFTLITQGSFLSAGVPVNINLPSSADYFKTVNLTQLAMTATPGAGCQFEWYSNPSFGMNSAIEWYKTAGTDAINLTFNTSGGFNYFTSFPTPEAPVIGTAITNANPAVVTMTNTYNEGDRVVLYNTVGMEQIGGESFTISSVSGSGFTLLGLDASGFSAPATAVTARRVALVNPVEPEFLYVTSVSQAAQAVVTFSTFPANVYVGQKLVFQIPASFGMTELNTRGTKGTQDLPAIVTSIDNAVSAYQVTINVNSTAFTPFAYPAASLSPTAPLFATAAPAGSSTQYNPILQTYTGYNFNQAPFRSGLFLPYMNLQAGIDSPAGQSGDTIVWEAYKAETTMYGSV